MLGPVIVEFKFSERWFSLGSAGSFVLRLLSQYWLVELWIFKLWLKLTNPRRVYFISSLSGGPWWVWGPKQLHSLLMHQATSVLFPLTCSTGDYYSYKTYYTYIKNNLSCLGGCGVEWSPFNLKVGSSIPSLPKSACRSVLGQDAEPRIAPHRTTKCC